MKKIFFISLLIAGLTAGYGFAQMHEGMMGSQGQQQTGDTPPYEGGHPPCHQMMGQGMMGYGMGPGMMGYGGYGMMRPDMMGYGMGPGMMGYGGYGMGGPCMMGYGMGPGMMGYGGYGMMGHHRMMQPGMMGCDMLGYNAEAYEKYLSDTKDLRKELHDKKFDYFEALRKRDTKPETITDLEKEIQDLKMKIYEKWHK